MCIRDRIKGVDIELPIQRMTYHEAMARYGSDKPDLRFGYELCDLSEPARGCGFSVFEKALEAGGLVAGINIDGGAKMSRKEIDALGEYSHTDKKRIVTLCRRIEAAALKRKLKELDPSAFVIVNSTSEIIGRGFRSS